MIGYVNIEEQVDADFDRARRRAFVRRVVCRLRNGCDGLSAFEEARRSHDALNRVRRGMRTVEVEKIAGSVGRFRDFDARFLPVRRDMASRWKRVDRAFHQYKELPPVSLYKLGERYFVLDGNHRVSVARYHGVASIDAEVTEFVARNAPGASDPKVA